MARLSEHAKIIGVNEAQLASDLLEMMAQDTLCKAAVGNKARKNCA